MKTLKRAIATVLLSLLGLAAVPALAEEKAVYIDVRSQAEYEAEHVEGTTLIPHTEIAERIGALGLDKSAPIKLFCRSGNRAGIARKSLEALGYTNVENIGTVADAREEMDSHHNH